MKKIILFFASGGFFGYSPIIPGTVGTLIGIPIAFIVSILDPPLGMIVIVAAIIFSIFIANEANRIFKGDDPREIVIDEIAGFLAASFLVPFSAINIIVVFILFRIFDILKPFPAGLIDRKLKGGVGIVLDDVAAGIYANIAAQFIIRHFL